MIPINDEIVYALQQKALELRRTIIEMVYRAGAGHPGGSLSMADMIAALYFHVLRLDPAHPEWDERDRFILSKGHACPGLYAALAHRGYFDLIHVGTLRRTHSILQGHPDMAVTPGVDFTAGSLGHGLAGGVGMALAARLRGRSYKVYVMMSDGEQQEGLVWEAALAGAHYRLHNLRAILDYNGLQIDGRNHEVMGIEPIAKKWEAFGWAVREIDGHDIREFLNAVNWADKQGGPSIIIAHTVKGKGVSYMEDVAAWHGRAPSKALRDQALRELGVQDPDAPVKVSADAAAGSPVDAAVDASAGASAQVGGEDR